MRDAAGLLQTLFLSLQALFQTVAALSLVGSYVVVIVLLVRLLFRRAPRWCSYLLWGIVFLRLCCPVFPEMAFSLIPSRLVVDFGLTAEGNNEETGSESLYAQGAAANRNTDGEIMTEVPYGTGKPGAAVSSDEIKISDSPANSDAEKKPDMGKNLNTAQSPDKAWSAAKMPGGTVSAVKNAALAALSCLWLAGMLACMGYHSYSYWRLKRRMRGAKEAEPGVREIEGEHLSFVMGIFRPVIYLSAELDKDSRRVVLCHERVHLKRKDYLIKPAALAICCVHWFNPLVWLAFYMMNRDCEMSCDERVVSLLGEESKKIYSYTLLDEATRGESKARRRGSVCALLSFGEDNVKNRVKHVLHYRKASVWMIAGAVVLLGVLLVGLCSNPRKESQGEQDTEGMMAGVQGQSTGGLTAGGEGQSTGGLAAGGIEQEAGNNGEGNTAGSLAGEKQFQTSAEKALNHFAQSYADRDGDALYELSFDKEAFEAWDMVTVLGENGSGARYAFGYSSPWVERFTIDYEEGSDEAVIRFILTNSAPEYYVAEERVKLTEQDGLFNVDHFDDKFYDDISSREELAQIYDLEAEHPFDNDSTGYSALFARTIFYHIFKETNPEYYDGYRDPVTAACKLLHLGEGTGEVTEVLYHAERQYPIGYSGDGSMYGEGTVVNVRYTFADDGSAVDIPMVMSEESKGVWMLSNGDLSKASEQDIGALPGENARETYGEYADYDEDGIWSRYDTGTYPDKGSAYQISSYGVYCCGYDYECIYLAYIPIYENVTVAFYEGKLYFPTDSTYNGGINDFMYDSICELNLSTFQYRYIPLSENARGVFPLSWFSVSDGIIRLYGENGSDSGYAFLLEDAEPVWEEKLAAELAEEEKDAYGVSLRQAILSNPDKLYSVGNRTDSNTFALVDMDGDGSTEEIVLTPIADDFQGYGPLDHYKLQCGGGFEERYGANVYNEIWAFSPDGKRIFIALYEDGPSGDPLTTLFRYEYNRLRYAGEFDSDIQIATLENGMIRTAIRDNTVQTDAIYVQYFMNDSGDLELVPQEYYEYIDKGGDIWKRLLVSLPLHTSPESEEAFTVEPCEVRFLAVHNSWEWVLVETKDGQQGWMHVTDGRIVELDMLAMDVFDGLSFAG